jgi:hypothetical protein
VSIGSGARLVVVDETVMSVGLAADDDEAAGTENHGQTLPMWQPYIAKLQLRKMPNRISAIRTRSTRHSSPGNQTSYTST